MMRRWLLVPAILLQCGASVASPVPNDAEAAIRAILALSARDKLALVDLDGDGVAEVLVYSTDPDECGSGGCDLVVFARQGSGYRRVADIGPAQLPIRILPTRTRGWSDLGVEVGGGGIHHFYEARLRSDGATYPDNPTVAPAIALRAASGRIVLAR